jgi:SAM-dependent methyltransferase
MQAYSAGFAHVYNQRWAGFARQAAPLIMNFYETTPIGRTNRSVLDLCCGTGQLAVEFLKSGYRVVGIDLSEPMLEYARGHAAPFLDSGQADFIRADATAFELDERFGLAVSTYDSLNHLEDERALKRCFERVSAVCDGYFIFDLNTRAGLRQRSGIQIDDSDEMVIIAHRLYDGGGNRAWTRLTGFIQTAPGTYRRCDETAFNTIFDIARVQTILREAGWALSWCTRIQDLTAPVEDPEKEGRIFIVARK